MDKNLPVHRVLFIASSCELEKIQAVSIASAASGRTLGGRSSSNARAGMRFGVERADVELACPGEGIRLVDKWHQGEYLPGNLIATVRQAEFGNWSSIEILNWADFKAIRRMSQMTLRKMSAASLGTRIRVRGGNTTSALVIVVLVRSGVSTAFYPIFTVRVDCMERKALPRVLRLTQSKEIYYYKVLPTGNSIIADPPFSGLILALPASFANVCKTLVEVLASGSTRARHNGCCS
ncbi:hypothetical protein R3P38DRAFT_2793106 [Favolaschia claudopus]|uniref:Uncharacterized protein n=1 Tax=Favolaschia claudopus TaxID=2862362 RepID=A0AAW0AE35_9AGAR